MNILLTHPVHGAKIAIAEEEAAMDEKNGWVRGDIHHPKESPVQEVAQVKRKYTKRASSEEVPAFLIPEG